MIWESIPPITVPRTLWAAGLGFMLHCELSAREPVSSNVLGSLAQ